jgi:peptidoglycan/LPS O-acetylase OafA/YrhL
MSETTDPHGAPGAADAPQVVTAVPELSAGTHFPCLDAYRGIGMTMVLMNHAAYATAFVRPDTTLGRTIGPLIARFDLSVPMFFVMSGFLLYRPFVKATLDDRAPLALRTFYRRRALRVFPAYWTALVLLGLIFGLQIASWKGWIGNALVLPAFGVPVQVCNDAGVCHVAYGITQAWSIGVEITFYLLLPLYAMLITRLARGREGKGQLAVLFGGLAVLYLASTAFRAYVVVASPSWAEQSLLWLPMFLDLFAIGMALAVLSAALAKGRAIPRALSWFGDHPNVCWIIAGVIFFGVTRMRYPDRPFGLHDSSGYSDYLPRQFLYGLASAIWLFPAMFGDQTKGVLRRILSSRPLVYLGAVSLSFYLWHLNIIDQVKAWTIPDYGELVERAAHPRPGNALDGVATFTGNYWLVVGLSFVLSLAVASVLFYVVELPFLKLKDQPLRALFKRRRPRGTGA